MVDLCESVTVYFLWMSSSGPNDMTAFISRLLNDLDKVIKTKRSQSRQAMLCSF